MHRVPPVLLAIIMQGGRATFVQHDGQGRAWFILDDLPAGAEKAYRPEALEVKTPPKAVEPVRSGAAVGFRVQEGPVLFYPTDVERLRPSSGGYRDDAEDTDGSAEACTHRMRR